ncbi:hypothetical protein SCHPADRAFT_903597 [Schizopora paradoxa]|uniref:F-box domain-containing protein n=1 Tax=Schizopora paradoxa TaxID=27342 RepID=A0A0H2RQC8_9AGAM|nr:hypothetical protein SCHPADRAFT_903597 [Schizopora paradoxa]
MGKRVLESAKFALEDVHAWISSQLHDCTLQIEAFELRSGFASFPDEILFRVLEFAAEEDVDTGNSSPILDDNEINFDYDAMCASIKNAFRLSHVCRRFRIVLSFSTHWRNICSSMNPDIISACVERCENANIPFDVYMTDLLAESFLRCPFNNSQLLKRFVFDWTNCFGHHYRVHFNNATKSRSRLHLPQLSEIIVLAQRESLLDIQRNSHFYAGWDTPSLRSMRTSDIIPVSFSGTSTLHSLSISMDQRWGDFVQDIYSMASFLESCPSLKEFSLQVENARVDDDVPELPPSEAPKVRRVEVKTVHKLRLFVNHCVTSYVENLVASVGFPGVSAASLQIKGNLSTLAHFCNNIQAIFCGTEDGDSHPRVTQLHLTVIRAESVWRAAPLSLESSDAPSPYTFFLCPKLLYLTLSLRGISPPNFNERHRLVPALRSLDFSNSSDMFSTRGRPIWEADELLCNLRALACGLIEDGLPITFDGIPLQTLLTNFDHIWVKDDRRRSKMK